MNIDVKDDFKLIDIKIPKKEISQYFIIIKCILCKKYFSGFKTKFCSMKCYKNYNKIRSSIP